MRYAYIRNWVNRSTNYDWHAGEAGGQDARKPQTHSVSVDAPNLAGANGWIGFGCQYCMDRRLGLASSEGYRVDRLIRRSPPVSMGEFRKNRREAVFLFAPLRMSAIGT